MKILHLVPTLSAGGAETFVSDLAVAQKSIGHDVDLFLIGGIRGTRGETLKSTLDDGSVHCYGTLKRNPRDIRNVFSLIRIVMFGKYDVIHAHLFSVELLITTLIPIFYLLRKKPLLVRTLHNANIYGTRSKHLTNMMSHLFDWNFACGQKVLKNYVALFGKNRVSVIENGVLIPTERSISLGNSIRAQLDLPANVFLVACIGAFRGSTLNSSQKAQDIAIRAFLAAFRNSTEARLILVGDGELRGEAESLVRELGGESLVYFLGNLPSSVPILKDADVLFMPSRYEGLPIVGLEAGCSGVPVLASRIDELLEVGSPYNWHFPDNNTSSDFAKRLIEIKENLSTVKKSATEMAHSFQSHYGMERCAKEYSVQIQSILQKTNQTET